MDPIDGTKEFAAGIPQFAVSVALVEGGVPVVGAVYNPLSGGLFTAVRGEGAKLNGRFTKAERPKRQSADGAGHSLGDEAGRVQAL